MSRQLSLFTMIVCAALALLGPSRAQAQVTFEIPAAVDTVRCRVLADLGKGKGYRFEFGREPSADDILGGQYGGFRRIDVLFDSTARLLFVADLVTGADSVGFTLAAAAHRMANDSLAGTKVLVRPPRGAARVPSSSASVAEEREQTVLAAEDLARARDLAAHLLRIACGPTRGGSHP